MTNSTGLHHSTQAGRQTHGNHMNMSSPEYDSSEGEDSDEEMLDQPQLPSLLSHLSLSGSFEKVEPLRSMPQTFNYLSSTEYNSRPGNSIISVGEQKDKARRGWTNTSQEKRSGETEFQARTKKAKLNHSYFRSQSLLAPPRQSNSFSSDRFSPSSTRTPSLSSSVDGTPPSSASSSLLFKPTAPSRLSSSSMPPPPTRSNSKSSPAWWPSVSLSSGGGRVSRFAPRESQFVGDGQGWNNPNGQYSNAQVREFNEASTMSSRSIRGISMDKNEDRTSHESMSIREDYDEEEDELGSDDEQDEREYNEREAVAAMMELYQRGEGGASQQQKRSITQEREEASPRGPQKEELMAVLRMRVSNAGGTTTNAQSGLRFKKWVAWNSWHRKSVIPLPAAPARSRPLVSVSSPPPSPLHRSKSNETIRARSPAPTISPASLSLPYPLTPRHPIVPRTRSLNRVETTISSSSTSVHSQSRSHSFTRISPPSPVISLPPSSHSSPMQRTSSSDSSAGGASSPDSSPPFSPDTSPPPPMTRWGEGGSIGAFPFSKSGNLKARQFDARYGKGVGIPSHEEDSEGMNIETGANGEEGESGREGCTVS